VTVDCLRADHVGFMGYQRPTTPFLDGLAQESIVVPAAIVAGVPTYYSFPAILASRFPLALGRDVVGIAPGEPTLATVLQDAGFATACFSASNPYISSRFGYQQGFHLFQDFLNDATPTAEDSEEGRQGQIGWRRRINRALQKALPASGFLGSLYDDLYFEYCQRTTPVPESLDALRRFPSADVLVDRAIDWVSSLGDVPFFLWLHLMDPHAPYYPKDAALSSMTGSQSIAPYRARYLNSYWNRSDLKPGRLKGYKDQVIGLYDAGIRWVDQQVARLVQSLQSSQRWDECIFALTADHGEEFLEHDGRYHAPSALAEELIRVPLLVRIPGETKREQGMAPFSLIHLAPTLLDSLEVPASTQFKGKSQLNRLHSGGDVDEVAISECVQGCTNPFHRQNRNGQKILSIRGRRFKLVMHFEDGTESLYDLESAAGERQALSPGAEKATRRRMLEIANEHMRSSKTNDQRLRLRAVLRDIQLELPGLPKAATRL